MHHSLKRNKCFASVVTLSDFFYSRFKRFFNLNVFYKIDFSLKISYMPICRCSFCFSFISQKHVAYSQKKYGISQVQFV